MHPRSVPIDPSYRPTSPSLTAAAEANRRGIALRAAGRPDDAIAAFRDGLANEAGAAELHGNLAITLDEAGQRDAARDAYAAALQIDPAFVPAHLGLGSLDVRAAQYERAEAHYRRAVAVDPDNVTANLALYELAQIAGRNDEALAFQLCALRRQQLFSQVAPRERRRILVLMAPGSWQANTPVNFLVDPETTTLHTLYLLGKDELEELALPPCDLIFNAIGESDEAPPALELASTVIARLGLPYLNAPQRVLVTNRVALVDALEGIDGCVVPPIARISRETVAARLLPVDVPFIIRPVDSHAGHDLARIDALGELDAYLERAAQGEFYVSPFVDYRSSDGFYRKYRIICVGGEPFAYHLAISPNWMIHYYNAPMREHAWMRAEEERYLADFHGVFGEALQRALRDVASTIGLEYFGIDCSIDQDGRLLIFEADPAMIVHVNDDPELFGYKHRYVPRIFAALERLIDSYARSN
ncbi:MAG TPA: tetratricopeptide repeat protein [Candidatus Baltobacteraceae bacterium]|jgi:tetratricopeptide (TPR) repeat protein